MTFFFLTAHPPTTFHSRTDKAKRRRSKIYFFLLGYGTGAGEGKAGCLSLPNRRPKDRVGLPKATKGSNGLSFHPIFTPQAQIALPHATSFFLLICFVINDLFFIYQIISQRNCHFPDVGCGMWDVGCVVLKASVPVFLRYLIHKNTRSEAYGLPGQPGKFNFIKNKLL